MRDVGAGVLPLDGAVPVAAGAADRLSMMRRFHRLRFQERCQIVLVRQCLAARPCRALAQGLECQLCAAFAFTNHAGKAAVAHDGNKPGDGARAVLIHALNPSRRRFRPHDPAMQHACKRDILDEARPGENFVGNVQALHRIVRPARAVLPALPPRPALHHDRAKPRRPTPSSWSLTLPGPEISPSSTLSAAMSTPRRSEAFSRKICRTSAQA